MFLILSDVLAYPVRCCENFCGSTCPPRCGQEYLQTIRIFRAAVAYNDVGSVTIDVRRVLDDLLRTRMRAKVAATERFDHRWLVHATLKDISWLRNRRGTTYTLNGADLAMGLNYLGETMSWTTLKTGIVLFSSMSDMDTQSIENPRHFGFFCFALLFNFPSLVYRVLKTGSLIAYSRRSTNSINGLSIHSLSEGTHLQHLDTCMECGMQLVSSMSACDIAASSASGTHVHFGAHPVLTHVFHL